MDAIILFGGSFDPIHHGHLFMIKEAEKLNLANELILIPNAQSPLKNKPQWSSEKRLSAIDNALHYLNSTLNITVSTYEIDKKAPSYTIDAVKHFKSLNPGKKLYFLLGSDSFLDLEKWKSYHQLAKELGWIVIDRGHHKKTLQAIVDRLKLQHVHMTQNTPLPISSSLIRQTGGRIVLGITGRAGSGKSKALSIAKEAFNVSVIDLDAVGHQLLEEGDTQSKLEAAFGTSKRDALSRIVFNDKKQLEKLNQLIHPIIKKNVETKLETISGPVIIVGALIQDIGLSDSCHVVITIDADTEKILKYNSKAKKILPHQRSRKLYQEEGAYCVRNNFTSEFKKDVISLFKTILI